MLLGQSLGCLQFLIQTEEVMLDLELREVFRLTTSPTNSTNPEPDHLQQHSATGILTTCKKQLSQLEMQMLLEHLSTILVQLQTHLLEMRSLDGGILAQSVVSRRW